MPNASHLSVMMLRSWLPGITGVSNDAPGLFAKTPEAEEHELSSSRRLGSRDWWRYYFAFTPPKNILLPGFFEKLFRLAGNESEYAQLADLLFDQVTPYVFSYRNRFEQVLEKLTPARLTGVSLSQCRGLVWFFFEHADDVLSHYQAHGDWFAKHNLKLEEVVDNLLRRLLEEDRTATFTYLSGRAESGKAWYWIVLYLQHLLWQNGIAGNRAEPEHSRVCTDEEVQKLCRIYNVRLSDGDERSRIAQLEDLIGFIFAWSEIFPWKRRSDSGWQVLRQVELFLISFSRSEISISRAL